MVSVILGDPYQFAIGFQTIPKWGNNHFQNGVLIYFVDGEVYPPTEIVNATLSSEIFFLETTLNNIVEDSRIYTLNKELAFSEMYERTYEPLNLPAPRFDIQPYVFGDNNCLVFAVRNNNDVRILASQLEYSKENERHILQDIHIAETFISRDDLSDIISGLEKWEHSLRR